MIYWGIPSVAVGALRSSVLSIPVMVIYAALFALPLAVLGVESIKTFEPGYVGSRPGAELTLGNYQALTSGAFLDTLFTTFRIGTLASASGLLLAFPLAFVCARSSRPRLSRDLLILFVLLMFLGVLVRTYALELMLGAVGPMRPVLLALGIAPNGRDWIEFCVAMGLMHYIIPLCVLTMIPVIRSINPQLVDSALSLGASRTVAHATITLPLCANGLLSAFLLSMTFSLSAFVIPMILGRGRVNFVSSLVYTRFSEIANYPSGAAIAITTLVLSLAVVAALSLAARRWTKARIH